MYHYHMKLQMASSIALWWPSKLVDWPLNYNLTTFFTDHVFKAGYVADTAFMIYIAHAFLSTMGEIWKG